MTRLYVTDQYIVPWTIRLSEYVWANFICIRLGELFCPKVVCDKTRILNPVLKVNTQGFGVANVYKNSDDETGKWTKLFFGMCFLNLETVEECFVVNKLPNARPENVCRLRREYVYGWISNIFTRDMVTLTVNVPRMVVSESFHREFGDNGSGYLGIPENL